MLIIDILINEDNNQFDDNDPDQFRMYRELSIKERKRLGERIKELEAVIQAALRISDLWTLKEVETMFEDEAKALDVMKQGFEQALKG